MEVLAIQKIITNEIYIQQLAESLKTNKERPKVSYKLCKFKKPLVQNIIHSYISNLMKNGSMAIILKGPSLSKNAVKCNFQYLELSSP